MSRHRRSCNAESNDTLDVEQNVAERVRPLRIAAIRHQEALCVLQIQEMEWMSWDDIEYGNIEDVLVVKDPEARILLFDPTTENVDHACDS